MNLTVTDHLLTTTRSVRNRLDFDRPVEREILEECLEIAIQAPTGSNEQGYHFLVIDDIDQKALVSDYYRNAFAIYARMHMQSPMNFDDNDPRKAQAGPVAVSAAYLAQNIHKAPFLVIPCIEGRVEESASVFPQALMYGSILPATWSLMLALRARGLGTAWTALHLMFEKQVAEALEIPDTITQVALLPIAYFKGVDFKPAKRIPAQQRTYWNRWGRGKHGLQGQG